MYLLQSEASERETIFQVANKDILFFAKQILLTDESLHLSLRKGTVSTLREDMSIITR